MSLNSAQASTTLNSMHQIILVEISSLNVPDFLNQDPWIIPKNHILQCEKSEVILGLWLMSHPSTKFHGILNPTDNKHFQFCCASSSLWVFWIFSICILNWTQSDILPRGFTGKVQSNWLGLLHSHFSQCPDVSEGLKTTLTFVAARYLIKTSYLLTY